jgi:probable rRNA maturation factor
MITGTRGGDLPPRVLTLNNRQRGCRIDGVHLRQIVRYHLEEQLGLSCYDLAIHLLSAGRMAEANARHLQHKGATDVITFDYADPGAEGLHGELLVCPAVAIEQAREFGTTWESEILRYIIHGVLHLRGYDDRTTADRRRMKREENRLLKVLVAGQSPGRLCARPRNS